MKLFNTKISLLSILCFFASSSLSVCIGSEREKLVEGEKCEPLTWKDTLRFCKLPFSTRRPLRMEKFSLDFRFWFHGCTKCSIYDIPACCAGKFFFASNVFKLLIYENMTKPSATEANTGWDRHMKTLFSWGAWGESRRNEHEWNIYQFSHGNK